MADGGFEPEDFGRLVSDLRPRLHRYRARMVGSAFDGEDVVQEALAKAAEARAGAGAVEWPERWLFRIAHNTALDALRRRKRGRTSGESDLSQLADSSASAEARVSVSSSLAPLMRLPVAQRACLVLVDVLGHSLDETADILGVTLAATKAALHRARTRLKDLGQAPDAPAPRLDPGERERLAAYADRFNARDFDALRALLAEDVRLDLVSRLRLDGRKEVSVYFTRYAEIDHWRFGVGLAEGRLALLVSHPRDPAGAVTYVVLLEWRDGQVAVIRDFLHASYVIESLDVARL